MPAFLYWRATSGTFPNSPVIPYLVGFSVVSVDGSDQHVVDVNRHARLGRRLEGVFTLVIAALWELVSLRWAKLEVLSGGELVESVSGLKSRRPAIECAVTSVLQSS